MKESEIRNIDALNRYLKLVEKDIEDSFDFTSFKEVVCPACGSSNFVHEFEKFRFRYVSCKNCFTLFVNPRPPFEALKKFYFSSLSSSFWVNEFFKPVAEARRQKIFKPRAEYINTLLDGKEGLVVGDIGAGFGLFLEELKKISPNNHYIAIEPSLEMSDICKRKGFEVKNVYFEELNGMEGSFNLLTAFELFEHLFDPYSFLEKVRSALRPGGYLLMTTLNCQGFDILILWEKSKSISPPHHLNFLNISSAKFLFERVGFEVMEISTPGELDWDMVENAIKNENFALYRFWNSLAKRQNDNCKKELQGWITKNKLSSHMRILVRR